MKKVLVISYYFPPTGISWAIRPVKFIKYFPKFNWHPIVVTSTQRTYFSRDDYLLEEVSKSGAEVYRTKGRKRNLLSGHKLKPIPNEGRRLFFCKLRRMIKFPDPQIKWKRKALKIASRIIESQKIDIIYAAAPPFTDFIIASELKKKYGIPLVIDYMDSWLHSADNFYPTRLNRFVNAKKELEVLRVADETITVNRRIKEHIIADYPNIKHSDVNIIPHGYDREEFSIVSQLPRTNKMRFTYAGSFFNLSSPKYFFEAFALALKKRPAMKGRVEACFIGVLSKEDHKLIIKNNLIESVYLPGYINHRETMKYLLSSDVLWFSIGKGSGCRQITPVKLSEYIGARKPILACIPEGVARWNLRFHDAVKICEPDDPNAIAELIIEYYDLYSKNALPVPDENTAGKYDVEKLTNELVRFFEFLIDITPEVGFVQKSLSTGSTEGYWSSKEE